MEQLASAGKKARDRNSPKVLNRLDMSLQTCLQEIMFARGHHCNNKSRIDEKKQELQGTLSRQLVCSLEVAGAARQALAALQRRYF